MSEAPIHQPHDKLFKASFSDPVNAAAFLRWEVPPALSGKIAWEQLRVEPGSFVDSHYRHTESDLLFSAKLAGSDSLLYLLFEHQTTPDPALALRLLRYVVRIWEASILPRPGCPSSCPLCWPRMPKSGSFRPASPACWTCPPVAKKPWPFHSRLHHPPVPTRRAAFRGHSRHSGGDHDAARDEGGARRSTARGPGLG